jgi:hypothetical protein
MVETETEREDVADEFVWAVAWVLEIPMALRSHAATLVKFGENTTNPATTRAKISKTTITDLPVCFGGCWADCPASGPNSRVALLGEYERLTPKLTVRTDIM